MANPMLPGAGSKDDKPITGPRPLDLIAAALSSATIQDLLAIRAEVERRLPNANLRDLDLHRELVLQVLALQQLQGTVLDDPDTPANQRAQVANSLSAALTTLVKVQQDVHNTERLKRLENALIEYVNALPAEMQHAAVDQYTALVEALR